MTKPPLFLHIGAPKTGTTYLQSLMREQRMQLRNIGMLVPGPKGRQKQAARDFVQHGGSSRWASEQGPWGDLVAEVRGWDGPAVISNETFGARLTDRHLAHLTADFADRELHVIFTVRDLLRQLPAAWQEAVKNGSTLGFADYVNLVSTPDSQGDEDKERRLWRAQDARQILAKWSQAVSQNHVHVVTVPQRGAASDLLWQRFAGVLGMDPAQVDPTAVRPNVSLGNVETNVLRRINQELMSGHDPMSAGDYIRFVKTPVANGVLQFPGARRPIHLTAEQSKWAAAESVRVADELSTLGYDLVGDLDEMRPTPAPTATPYEDPDQPAAQDERDAAITTLVGLIQRNAKSSEKA
jgi:hypothetical protein